ETFGSGNVMDNKQFLSSLAKAIGDGTVVLNVSQCVGGSVIHGKYEASRRLTEIGVVSGHDITTEAALAKMMHLLAYEKSFKGLCHKLSVPLRGELTASF